MTIASPVSPLPTTPAVAARLLGFRITIVDEDILTEATIRLVLHEGLHAQLGESGIHH
jgi:hypothetical protein